MQSKWLIPIRILGTSSLPHRHNAMILDLGYLGGNTLPTPSLSERTRIQRLGGSRGPGAWFTHAFLWLITRMPEAGTEQRQLCTHTYCQGKISNVAPLSSWQLMYPDKHITKEISVMSVTPYKLNFGAQYIFFFLFFTPSYNLESFWERNNKTPQIWLSNRSGDSNDLLMYGRTKQTGNLSSDSDQKWRSMLGCVMQC